MSSKPDCRNEDEFESGYSLLETLIALAILALGAAVSLPQLGLLKGQLTQLDTAGVIADLKSLRDDAMLTGVSTFVRVTSYGYILEPGKIERRLRSAGIVSISATDSWDGTQDPRITFFPDGSSTGGIVTLQMGGGTTQISVDPMASHGTEVH